MEKFGNFGLKRMGKIDFFSSFLFSIKKLEAASMASVPSSGDSGDMITAQQRGGATVVVLGSRGTGDGGSWWLLWFRGHGGGS